MRQINSLKLVIMENSSFKVSYFTVFVEGGVKFSRIAGFLFRGNKFSWIWISVVTMGNKFSRISCKFLSGIWRT